MMKLKNLVVLVAVSVATFTPAFSSNQTISRNKDWKDIDSELGALSNGDTLFVEARIKIKKNDDGDELKNKNVVIMIESDGELLFYDSKSDRVEIFLGSGSKIVIMSGGEITADHYSGRKRVFINNAVVSTASGSNCDCATEYGSSDNFTDPNGTLPSFTEVTTSGGVDANGALPVTWGYVELKEPTPASVTLNWSTMSEMNNSHFEVQLSTDGASWNVVDVVESKAVGGNSAVRLTYSNEISLTGNSSLYYVRLKQVDFDGQFDYSDIKVHRVENLFPSKEPRVATLGQGTIEITGNNFTHLSVYTAHGQLIWDQDIQNTVQVHLDNTGAHWLLFSNKSGQIFKVKHMVTY
jgi:hypothetical protein